MCAEDMIRRYVSRFGSSVWFQISRLKVGVGMNTWSEFVDEEKKSVLVVVYTEPQTMMGLGVA